MKSLLSKLKPFKEAKTSLTLEYLIILQQSGLPIYSKCWGNFCSVLVVDDTLLSGFLSAITSMPKMLNQNTELSAIEMGFSKLLFNYTTPTGHIICGGFRREEINDKVMPEINGFFSQISDFLEQDYKNTKWQNVSDETMKEFENTLLTTIVEPWFHTVSSEHHSDDMCPFCSTGKAFKGEEHEGLKISFSERISKLYTGIKTMFKNPQMAGQKEQALKLRETLNKRANIES